MFGERRSSRHARLGCRNCSKRPIRFPRELRRRVRKSKEESIRNAPKSSAGRHWSAIVSCFVLWRKDPPRRIFGLCGVAVAYSPLLVRMQQIGLMAEHPLARPMRAWLPEIDFGVMHHALRGHNHALILQAARRARSPHSCRGVAIRNTDTMRSSFVLHGSAMMHDSLDGVSNNVLFHRAPRFRHAVDQT